MLRRKGQASMADGNRLWTAHLAPSLSFPERQGPLWFLLAEEIDTGGAESVTKGCTGQSRFSWER